MLYAHMLDAIDISCSYAAPYYAAAAFMLRCHYAMLMILRHFDAILFATWRTIITTLFILFCYITMIIAADIFHISPAAIAAMSYAFFS